MALANAENEDPTVARSSESLEWSRISKPDMFMAVALWMERSPLAQSPSEYLPPTEDQDAYIKKSGSVFVLPNDRVLSVDCSQDGVHAAVRALNKFGQERAKGCQVYLSRRPCSFCAKLLVQCKVAKVYFLPIEPELDDPNDVRIVDTMFMTSSCGLSIKIPRIEEAVVEDHDKKESPYTGGRQTGTEAGFSEKLLTEYWNSHWIGRASDVLNWPAFRDQGLQTQIENDMKSLMKWIAHTTVKDVPDDIIFVELKDDYRTKEQNIPGETGEDNEGSTVSGQKISRDDTKTIDTASPSSPQQHPGISIGGHRMRMVGADGKAVSTGDDKVWQSNALHMSRLAQMLSQRSDDPTRGVGCVLVVHDDAEIVAIGWNGFPAKALFGEFPRASNTEEESNKKEPYVIHAEQNALLTRNQNLKKDDDSSTLFINEVPCNECVPLLIQAGVKKIVIPKLEGSQIERGQISGTGDSKEAFKSAFKESKFDCYGSKRPLHRRNISHSM